MYCKNIKFLSFLQHIHIKIISGAARTLVVAMIVICGSVGILYSIKCDVPGVASEPKMDGYDSKSLRNHVRNARITLTSKWICPSFLVKLFHC